MPQQVPKDQNSASVPADRQTMILAPSTASLDIGETLQLTVSGAEAAVKFSSNRTAVASVTKTGLVRARAVGVAVITAKAGNAKASSTITVGSPLPPPAPIPPNAVLELVSNGFVGDNLIFSTEGTLDPDGAIHHGEYDFGDTAPTVAFTGAPPTLIQNVYTVPGTYLAQLTVVDTQGLSSTATLRVVVEDPPAPPDPTDPPPPPPPPPPPNQSPLVSLSYLSGQFVGDPYTILVAASDPDGAIASYTYNWGDGTTGGAASDPNGLELSHVYTAAGTYTITVTVTDNGSKTTSTTRQANIGTIPAQNLPPVAAFVQTGGALTGDTFSFSTVGTNDPDGTIASYAVNWGDGTGISTTPGAPPAVLSHLYSVAGAKSVTLLVTDNSSLTASKTVTVAVTTVPPPPTTSPIADGVHPRLLMTPTVYQADTPTPNAVRLKVNASSLLRTRIAEGIVYLDARYATATSQGGQVLVEITFGYAWLSQILATGTITGASPAHTAAEYGAKAAACALVYVTQATPPGFIQEAYYTGFLTTYVYDWAWSHFTAPQRATYAAFLKAASQTGHWQLGAGYFQNGAVSMIHYMVQNACALAGDGADDPFWADIVGRFASLVLPNATGTIRSWAAHGLFTGAAITEGSTYLQYTHIGGLEAAECYRTATGQSKTALYTAETMTQYTGMGRLLTSLTLPYGLPSGSWPGGVYRGTWRSHYGHTWLEGQNPDAQASYALACAAGVLGFLNPTLAGLNMWAQENRTTQNATNGNGGQPGPSGYVGWMFRAILGDETISPISPTDAGMALAEHYGTGPHVFRESLTADDTWMVLFHTPKWGTGAASGRSPSNMAGHLDIHRKGPQVIIRGNKSHNGAPAGFNRVMFPPIVRVRQDEASLEAGGGVADEVGDVRSVTLNQLASIGSSAQFVENGVADILGTTRTLDRADLNYVYADLTKAYYWAEAVSNAMNPRCVDRVQADVVVLRGGSGVRVIRCDRWGLVAGMVGVREPVLNLATSTIPTVTGGTGGSAGPSRNGTTFGRTQYGAATTATATNTIATYSGKTTIQLLLPAARTVIRNGGPNEGGQFYRNLGAQNHPDNSCEYMDACGFRFAPSGAGAVDYTSRESCEVGNYWTEVVDTSGAAAGAFLYTFDVRDSGGTPDTVEDWAGTLLCARIGDGFAAFPPATSGSVALTSGTIVAKTAGTYFGVLTNVASPAARTLTPGASITIDSRTNDSASGTIYVILTISGSGTGAANTLTMS